MEFNLHPSFAEWIDREAIRVADLIEDVTDKVSTSGGRTHHPDLHIKANINREDIIGEVVASRRDVSGKLIAWFYPHQGKILGLMDNAMVDAQKVAERIWERRELCELVSRTTILELLLDFVGAKVRGAEIESLSTGVTRIVIDKVKTVSVWIPIDELIVEGQFRFATGLITTISRAQIDAAINAEGGKRRPENVERLRNSLYTEWAGRAAMCFEVLAEPRRAQEIAIERAVKYMSLIQFYTAPAMVLPLVSHIAPRGARPYRTQECIVSGDGGFEQRKGVSEPMYQFVIHGAELAHMEKTGLMVLSSLAQCTCCDYEESLLNSLLIYGRAFYHVDPSDKLLQVMTAVEMFALRSDSEPIQATIADRMAFAIAQEPHIRQEIVRNLRLAYSARSGRTHHGVSISDTEVIEQFLRNAWAFFLTAVQGVGRFKTRVDFLDYLDKTKYGHGSSNPSV